MPMVDACSGAVPEVLGPTTAALEATLTDFVNRGLPHRRVARLAGLLLLSGVDGKTASWPDVAGYLASKQCSGGAWVDCEDTTWCNWVLSCLGAYPEIQARSIAWLTAERSGGGWGYCIRDQPCIPITATVRLLVPALRDVRSNDWLHETWVEHFSAPVRLSYKAAWYLLARNPDGNSDLGKLTLEHLIVDQRESGGWGPWRDHPAATDCFSTGIAMWAVASQPADARSVEALRRAVSWCESERNDDGLFPTHFIEEGSAWIHLGWAAALRRLADDSITDRPSCAVS